jgi:hypothetical protein
MVLGSYNHWCSEEPDHEIGREVCRDVQQCACGRGYRRAADVSSFCTLADGVIVQMICCTNNGRLFYRSALSRYIRTGYYMDRP